MSCVVNCKLQMRDLFLDPQMRLVQAVNRGLRNKIPPFIGEPHRQFARDVHREFQRLFEHLFGNHFFQITGYFKKIADLIAIGSTIRIFYCALYRLRSLQSLQ